MLQRVQTLYLLAIVILGITLAFMPVLSFSSSDDALMPRSFELSAMGLTETTLEDYPLADMSQMPDVSMPGIWGLSLATWLIPVLAFIIIFLYKNRILQARLSIFLFMLCIGYYGVMLVFAWFGKHNIAREWSPLFWSCIPLICAVLTAMSVRRILKDEALVRAADRLR